MNDQTAGKKERPYGLWKSAVTIESLIEQASTPAYPFKNNGKLYWLEAQSREDGRIALMQKNLSGPSGPSGQPICITPENFNIRTAVHEYGGRCFCVVDDNIVFNNYKDGNLYWQSLKPSLTRKSTPQQLSRNPNPHNCCGYADLVAIGNGKFILGIMETTQNNGQNCNCIVALSLGMGSEGDQIIESEPIILAQGADFYANPVISSDGKKIAWFEWSHPNMPWDQSRLVCAQLKVESHAIFLDDREVIVDEQNCAVCQLGFLDDNKLIFVSDSDTCDYWSMFQYHHGEITRLTHGNEEFGEAHWIFGQRRWQPVGDGMIIAVATREDRDVLVAVDSSGNNSNGHNCTVLDQEFSACSHLQIVDASELLFIAHYSNRCAEIVSLSIPSGGIWQSLLHCSNKLRPGSEKTLPAVLSGADSDGHGQGHSKPRLIKFPTTERDAERATEIDMAYGYFYPPYNPMYCAPENTLPPLMIVIHGGPTSRATSEYSSLKQYFCSLGFALLDINHRGSTGLGRKYRQSLLGNWGEFDADDIASAIDFVSNKKWIDKTLVFIRGSSAGGYAVLRSLTQFPRRFAGGACYYGIGNLVTLSQSTHKFESKYTDRLVGEKFDPETSMNPESRFVTRSPVFQIDKLSSPLILFQGAQDKVVPPALSREVAKRLKTKGIKHSYTEYPGEGHGFRQTQTRVDALRKETAFFAKVIRRAQSNRKKDDFE